MRLVDADNIIADLREMRKNAHAGEEQKSLEAGINIGIRTAIEVIDEAEVVAECDECKFSGKIIIGENGEIRPLCPKYSEVVKWINMDEAEPPIGKKIVMLRPPNYLAVMRLKMLKDKYYWIDSKGDQYDVFDNDYWIPIPDLPKVRRT